MKGSTKTALFQKKADCPSSNTLLSFEGGKLAKEIETLVGYHLLNCDFCNSELVLLTHCRRTGEAMPRTPEIPINLRILAESLLSKVGKSGTIH